MIWVLYLVGEKIVCVIRIKSAIIAVARLPYTSPRYANKLPVKKIAIFNPNK
jgi:hypothetical protein